MSTTPPVPKAKEEDILGRFREIVSDPINLLIRRDPRAGLVEDGLVYLHNGLKVPFAGAQAYYGDFSRILVVNRGVHEPLQEFVFQELIGILPRAPRMIELGAYWGHYSMWLKSLRPAATVVLVEPEAENIRVGARNFELNGFTGEFIQAFVGKGQFAMDAFLAQRALEKIDVLHCDIEGYELEMLADCSRALEKKAIDYVFLSTHSQAKHYEALEALDEQGYTIEVTSDYEHGTTFCDGLIFASSPNVKPLLKGFNPLGRVDIPGADPAKLVEYLQRVMQCRK